MARSAPASDGIKEERQLFRLVRTVGVHFHQDVIACGQTPLETCDVGSSEAFLALAVKDMYLAVLCGEVVGKLSRAVWTVVVHHQDIGVRHCCAQPSQGHGERFQLVVGGNDRQDTQEEAFP